jgi:acetyltransferase-like isoleucine patch superfamily enzyme
MRNPIAWLRRRNPDSENRKRIERLRRQGVRIGQGCLIFSTSFSTEPYLIQIGDRVAIAAGVRFITHNALAFRLRDTYPNLQVFAPITVGDGTIIGLNAIILPGTVIGRNCFISAGAVVRGTIADDSAVGGNPAEVFGKVSDMMARLPDSPGRLDVYHLPPKERRERIERHFGLG